MVQSLQYFWMVGCVGRAATIAAVPSIDDEDGIGGMQKKRSSDWVSGGTPVLLCCCQPWLVVAAGWVRWSADVGGGGESGGHRWPASLDS